jgi:hypothetical protein
VRNTVLASAVAAALGLGAPAAHADSKGAATKAELQAMQAQMEALTQRLNRLEAANASLAQENTELKAVADRRDAEMDYLKAQTKDLREETAVQAGALDKVKGADWATRVKARGDLRYRHEMIDPERVVDGSAEDAAKRTRERIRARFGFDAKVTDNVKATVQFATGGDDPRSTNQTLGGTYTRKAIGVDLAYADWQFMNGTYLALGKQPQPYWRPGQSLFFDGDITPEGGSVRFDRGMLFGSAYGWWLTEQYNSDPKGENSDANIFGAQLGLKFPLFDNETRIAVQYFDCGACKDNSPLYANNGNGNTTYKLPGSETNLLKYDYQILELSAQMGLSLFDMPFAVWADYAQNLASGVEYDTVYGLGVMLGKASNAKTWEAGVMYQSLDKDALFGQLVDSDFGDGKTDTEGWMLKGGYAPVKGITLNATYFINTLNKDVGTQLDYQRLQLDINYKF